jgi:hypothetical protein
MAKLQTFSTFPAQLHIDGVAIAVCVKRLTNTEFDAYTEAFDRWMRSPRGPEETADERREREKAAEAWMREVLEAYLSIERGEYEHDGREVTSGGELFDIFFARQDDVAVQALTVIHCENRLSEAQKKTYQSLLASQFGSMSAPPKTGDGNAAASTAGSADENDSTSAAAVTESLNDDSSGTTDPTLERAAAASA